MRISPKRALALIGASSVVFAPAGHAQVEIIPLTSFDPNTFFDDGFTAGIDFDDDSNTTVAGNQLVTEEGFLSIPPSNNKSYNVTTNGITFDIQVINANQGNQNRWRNRPLAGDLMNDFEQWYGSDTVSGNPVEATFTLTGLTANTDYLLTFFTANVAAGQTNHNFHDGASSAAPLITSFTTAGNENNYAAWVPGITFKMNSGSGAQIVVTIVAPEFANGANSDSRLTFDGMTVTAVAPPPALDLDFTITRNAAPGLFDLSWTSQGGKVYDLLASTDLATPVADWPVYNDGVMLYENIPATGTTTTLTAVPSAVARRFFALREEDAPPLLAADFEEDNGDFTLSKTAGTDWAWGDPDSAGPGGTVTTGNGPSTNCWGTNLGAFGGGPGDRGFYADPTTDSRLISPVVNLTGIAGAELSFAQAIDIPGEDSAVVRIFNADTNVEIVSGAFPLTIVDINSTAAAWATAGPYTLPVGAPIRIVWSLTGSGGSSDDYLGWYIDDVVVVETAP
jgi:hypothetical protein